jgi:hypothetical protein
VQSDARLANSSWAGQSHGSGFAEKLRYVRDQILATHESRERRRKVPEECVERFGTGKHPLDIGVSHLIDAFRVSQALKPMDTEVDQARLCLGAPFAVLVDQRSGDRRRCDDLAPVADRHHSSALVEGGSKEVAVALLGSTRMNAHSYVETVHVREIFFTESALDVNCGLHDRRNILKVRDDSVARVLEQ